MTPAPADLSVISVLAAALVALGRMAFLHQKSLVDKFIQFSEQQAREQAERQERITSVMRDLGDSARETAGLIRKLGEQLGVRFRDGGGA